MVEPAEVAELEPALPPAAGRRLLPGRCSYRRSLRSDPTAGGHGGIQRRFVSTRSRRAIGAKDGKIRLISRDLAWDADKVVLAAGAWSRSLARQGGENVPLDTERGYHIEFAMDACPIKRPVSPVDLGFYVTPMDGRLRVAGLVELGGLFAPANPNRIALLERGIRKLLPNLGPVHAQWLGFRPSLPNSLPVIGRARRSQNLILAFGHGHLGMTLAGVTSRIVAGLIQRRNDAPELSAFGPSRFA